jgi:hypothetical protein
MADERTFDADTIAAIYEAILSHQHRAEGNMHTDPDNWEYWRGVRDACMVDGLIIERETGIRYPDN